MGVPAFALFSARETGRGGVVLISFDTLHLCFPCLALVRSLAMVEVGRRILLRIFPRDHLTRCPAHLFVVLLSECNVGGSRALFRACEGGGGGDGPVGLGDYLG